MGEGVSAHDRSYNEIKNFSSLVEKGNSYLEDFNSMSKEPMHLVLFEDAMKHIMRISRILRLSKGNALLVGLGGSGRKSLSKLSAFICDYEVFSFEVPSIEDWKENVKKLLR